MSRLNLLVCGLVSLMLGTSATRRKKNFEEVYHGTQSNIILLMFDDLGRSDISAFGAEWDTPNIDLFLEESIVLSHHYIGYVCSASRSQFLTGRYSFHNGYGTLNVFDIEKLGAIPLSTPTIAEYLQQVGDYNTYAIGKWQLGNPTYSNMAYSRGFDHFWGFNGGMEDYRTKVKSMPDLASLGVGAPGPDQDQAPPQDQDQNQNQEQTANFRAKSDLNQKLDIHADDVDIGAASDDDDNEITFRDFWHNLETAENWDGDYSTDQYVDKAIEIIKYESDEYYKATKLNSLQRRGSSSSSSSTPFFMYIGFQAIHFPFSEDTSYYQDCVDYAMAAIDTKDNEDRMGVCESILGVDYQLGRLLDYFQSDSKTKALWDNTLIILTSDNGGDIDEGSCNYPLRGGKNTFFEGGQRVLAAVGGGIIPDTQRGVVLDGLVSNVDWFPTILSFANLIPSNSKHSFIGDSSQLGKIHGFYSSDDSITEMDIEDTLLVFDGYNIYDYIMDVNGECFRDHVLFHIQPTTEKDDDDNDSEAPVLTKPIGEYGINDFHELAILFYDEDGTLWKYFDVSKSTNPIGNPGINSGWCTLSTSEMATNPDALVGKITDPSSPSDNNNINALNLNSTYTYVMDESLVGYGYLRTALFDITNDFGEENNYLSSVDDDTEDIISLIPDNLLSIIQSKVDYYTNKNKIDGSLNSNAMYGSLDCFTMDETFTTTGACLDAALENGAWVPFYSVDEWREEISDLCNLDNTHPLYTLFNSELNIPDVLRSTDNSAQIVNLNALAIEDQDSQKRKFDEFTSKYSLDDLNAVDDDDTGDDDDDSDDDNYENKKIHSEMDGINMNGDHYASVNSRSSRNVIENKNKNKNNEEKRQDVISSKNERRNNINMDKSGLISDERKLKTGFAPLIIVSGILFLFAIIGVVGSFGANNKTVADNDGYIPLN